MRLTLSLCLAAGLIAGAAHAQDSGQHFDKAITGLSDAAGNLGASGLQAAGGASAIPVSVVGTVSVAGGASAIAAGSVAGEVGLDSVKTAQESVNETWGAPLTVDNRVVVAPDPAPKKALAR